MKLKGISKLVLAGTALAATAATLTTATYAWYVTNAKVQATGVQGSVAGTAAGSLFIAQNTHAQNSDVDEPGVYTTKITLTNTAVTGYQQPANGLDAISKATVVSDDVYYITEDTEPDTTKTYYTIASNTATAVQGSSLTTGFVAGTAYYEKDNAGTGWVDKEGKSTASKLLTFKFWLKSSAAGTAAITLKVDNITATANPQKALSGTGVPQVGSPAADVAQGQSFVVDAVHALRMQIDKTPYTNDGTTMTAGTKTSETYQVDSLADGYDTANTTAATTNGITFATGGDAGTYFQSIMAYAPYGTAGFGTANGAGTSTDGNTGTAPADTVSLALEEDKDTLLEFSVWLEGSDAQCFDSCRGQAFKFDFEFAFTATPANNG